MTVSIPSASGPCVHFDHVEDLQAAASSIFVPLQIDIHDEPGFHAIVQDASLGPVVVTRIRITPATVSRRTRLITSADPELVKITLHRRGRLLMAQDDKRSLPAPGDLIACETSRPYRLVGRDLCDVVVIGIPRPMLGTYADLITRRTATAISGDRGMRSIIAAFLSGLADNVDDLPTHVGVHLADALTSLIIAAFTDTPAVDVETSSDLADRITAYALANLSDPNLSVVSVARHHGMSIRYVHKVLRQRDMTFAAWVRHERLHRIRRDLLDPAFAQLTVAAIAARWGILDSSHLARAFRAEFGEIPAEIRRAMTG